MANILQLLGAVGKGVEGYGIDRENRVKSVLAKSRETRDVENDRIRNLFTQQQTAALSAPKPDEYFYDPTRGARVNVTQATAEPIAGLPDKPVVPPPPRRQVVGSDVVDLDTSKATPIAGLTPTVKPPDPQRIASREDRLSQNFQQEPAVKHAALLANAAAQLEASAQQKTPQGDLNMLYGAVKLRDPNAVREGELALNNKARSLHTQLFSLWDRVSQGRILTDAERQQVMDLVDETVTQQSKLVAPVQARYGKQARQAGADSSFVAPDPFEGVRGRKASAVPSFEDWKAKQGKP